MGDLLPGVALRFTPGYHISPLRGLGSTARHSQPVEQKGSGLFFSAYHILFLVQTHCRKRDLTPFVLQKQKQRHGRKIYLSEPDALATV